MNGGDTFTATMTRATLHVVPGRRRLAVTYRTAESANEEALRCHLLLHHPRRIHHPVATLKEGRSWVVRWVRSKKIEERLTYLLKGYCSADIKIRRFNVLLTRGFAFRVCLRLLFVAPSLLSLLESLPSSAAAQRGSEPSSSDSSAVSFATSGAGFSSGAADAF